jgi:hypothetical protein
MVTPDQRREALAHVQAKGLSGRAACRWTGLSRSVLRYSAKQSDVDEQRLIQMRQASQRQPRFGYRRVGVLVGLSFKIAWRLWKIGHFRLGKPRPRRRRRGGSEVRPEQAQRPNHVWTYDILHDQLADGKRFKTLSVLDEFTRECLAIHVGASHSRQARDPGSGAGHDAAGCAGLPALGQRQRVHCHDRHGLAARSAGRPRLHSPGPALAKRIHRKFPQPFSR